MSSPFPGRFSVVSFFEARLEIERRDSPFGLVVSPRQEHGLGMRDAPRFRVVQPFDPDAGWRFEPRTSGLDVPDTWSPRDETERLLADWLAGTSATRGRSVFRALPRGRYRLVRCRRPVLAPAKVLMGNDLVPRPANVRVLRQEEPLFAGIVGAAASEPPCLDQPLVGLAVLNYVGAFSWQGLVFFPPAAHLSPATEPGGDLVLVIPLEGELVIDNLGGLNAEWERISLERWQERYVPLFQSWCTCWP